MEAREEVSTRLVELGWAQPERAALNPRLRYCLFLPGDAEILPAAWLMPKIGERSGQISIGLRRAIGFECPAARQLTTALLGRAYSGVVLKRPRLAEPLAGSGQAAKAVDALVEFVVTQQSTLASRDVDSVIESLQHGDAVPATTPSSAREADEPHDLPPYESTAVAVAMLASLGRYGDASTRLAPLRLTPSAGDHLQARFVHQLGRWIDAAGNLPLPTSPARWGLPQMMSPSDGPQSRSWSEHRASRLAEREAVAAVRAISRGKDRLQLRTLLERELNARGLQLPQSSIERHLDFLVDTQSAVGTARTAIRGIRGIANFVKDAGGREGPLEAVLARPDSDQHYVAEDMRLPARATYPVASLGEKYVIRIDPDATQLVQGLVRGGREMDVHVWFTEDESTVAVHIGPNRVARLPEFEGRHFAAPIAAAAERDELPWTDASLSEGPSGLQLRLALPALPELD